MIMPFCSKVGIVYDQNEIPTVVKKFERREEFPRRQATLDRFVSAREAEMPDRDRFQRQPTKVYSCFKDTDLVLTLAEK